MKRALRFTAAALLLAGAVAGSAAAPARADSPLRLDNQLSLLAQFHYSPAYERNLPSFDAANRAYIRSRTARQDGTGYAFSQGANGFRRARCSTPCAARTRLPRHRQRRRLGGETIEADSLGRLYTLLEVKISDGSLRNLLLYSIDSGRTWRVRKLPFTPPRRSPDGRNDGPARPSTSPASTCAVSRRSSRSGGRWAIGPATAPAAWRCMSYRTL